MSDKAAHIVFAVGVAACVLFIVLPLVRVWWLKKRDALRAEAGKIEGAAKRVEQDIKGK